VPVTCEKWFSLSKQQEQHDYFGYTFLISFKITIMENSNQQSREKQQQSVEINDNDLIRETKLSILQVFSKYFPPKQGIECSQTSCGICFKTLPSVNYSKDQLFRKISEEEVGVVLQSLLVPQNCQIDKISNSVPLLACKKCNEEFKALIDIFLKLEDLRKDFESVRLKLAKKIIIKSAKKTTKHFQCWEKEAERVGHIFPSLLQLQEVNNERVQSDKVENTISFAEDKYAAIKEKYKRIHKGDLKLTDVSLYFFLNAKNVFTMVKCI